MEVRPHRAISRRKTKEIKVGNISVPKKPTSSGKNSTLVTFEKFPLYIFKLNHYGLKYHRFLNLTKVSCRLLLKYKSVCIII